MTGPVAGQPDLIFASVAINRYQSSPLRGCLQDQANMVELARWLGFRATTIADGDATAQGIGQFIREQVRQVGPDSHLLLHYSGHGSEGPTQDAEHDGLDECWVSQDMQAVWDNQLAAWLGQVHPKGQITVVSDSCHSEDVTRAAALGVEDRGDGYRAAKHLPMDQWLSGTALDRGKDLAEQGANLRTLHDLVNRFNREVPRVGDRPPPVFLFAACKAREVTYDAFINGVTQGCFTRAWIDSLKELMAEHSYDPKVPAWFPTNLQLYGRIKRKLPSEDYDSHPQISGVGARWVALQVNTRR
jgi:hypothetical protein